MVLQFFPCLDLYSDFYRTLDHYLSSQPVEARGHYVSAIDLGRGKGGLWLISVLCRTQILSCLLAREALCLSHPDERE
jgi:hypothetical protein